MKHKSDINMRLIRQLRKQKPMSDVATQMKELVKKMQRDRNDLRQRLNESEETIQKQSEVMQVLLDCLSKEKNERFCSADELMNRLFID